MPERFVDRHVGGNTTYARHIEAGLRERGIPVGRIRAGGNPLSTMAHETLAGLARGDAGDVLHYVADTGPLLGTRRPTVVTVHGVASRWINVARTRRQEWQWRTRVQRAVSSADHVITVSNSSANDICDVFGITPENVTTIEHGVDVEKFSTPTAMSHDVAQLIPRDFILYLGNIEPRKNLVNLIEAFAQPAVRELGLQLVIAGKPAWNAEATMRAIQDAPHVTHLGFVSDADRTALMQRCRAFAFPSLYEGFGFPVVEALAAGAVVVTSQRGSLAEVAGPALRFPSLEVDGIAAGIALAARDTAARSECLQAAPTWVQKFSWESSVEKHVGVYRKVLA